MKDQPLTNAKDIYVQYGCGMSCPEGWTNFDASPTLWLQRIPYLGRAFQRKQPRFPNRVRYGNIVKGLPIAKGSASGVYASHVLEHLCLTDFWIALTNTFDLLKPGGVFRLVIPDLQARARKYIAKLDSGDVQASSWFMASSGLGLEIRSRGFKSFVRALFGNSSHLWMWDERSMAAALIEVGFINVRRCQFNDSEDEAFHLIEEPGRFYDKQAGIEECAMEAIKPCRST